MLEQIFEFIGNHYVLVSVFTFLLVAFIINEGKQGGAAITPGNLVQLVNREGAVIVDLREKKDFGAGHIAGAVNIPFSAIDSRKGELEAFKEKPVVLVCKMGQSAGPATRQLREAGFARAQKMTGGMMEWTALKLPVVSK